MFTIPWSVVDRKIGLGIALCGVAIVLLNSLAFIEQASQFQAWWVTLAGIVPLLQLLTAVGWSKLPPAVLRSIWISQVLVLLFALVLVYNAWDDGGRTPYPLLWLLDSTVVAALALTVRLAWALAATLLLAASVPLSALAFLGTIPASVLSWGFVHASNVIFVMLALVMRQQTNRLARARATAEHLQAEEERVRAASADFERFARVIHDEVLSTFGAAVQLTGDPPPLLRRSATAALDALRHEDFRTDTEPVERTTEEAQQLILDLIGAAAPGIEVSSKVTPGTVTSTAAGAVGLAAAEASRNALRHAGGGSGTVMVGDGSIRVIIVDAGPGFDPAKIRSGHFGISGSIVRRIDDLDGGRVAFDSGAGGTTVVMAWSRPRK
ncbi:ATP-binding protein [Brooklawnia sp.]|uniref:sensor histidine kinase n=1 Tax=Brooklawnia sp. TaxID=2699740 RepID=UPI00311F0F7B